MIICTAIERTDERIRKGKKERLEKKTIKHQHNSFMRQREKPIQKMFQERKQYNTVIPLKYIKSA